MELSEKDLQGLIQSAIVAAVAPLQEKISALEAAQVEAPEPAPEPASVQEDKEAREAAEMGSYLKGMRQRLINAGLISPEYNNI